MKAVAVFLLGLCCLAISHAWTCDSAPTLNNVLQVDAGQGKVVAVDKSYYPYFLSGTSWTRLTYTQFKHVSVGRAGLWASDTSNRVHKYVGGNFVRSSGLYMQQVDAGSDQLVGVQYGTYRTGCVKSSITSLYTAGTLSWTYLPNQMKYYSCGPLYGCWGVDTSGRIWVTKNINSETCVSSSWTYVSAGFTMVEVGSDGNVIAVTTGGLVYQRSGISSRTPQGTRWVTIPMCMKIRHVTYDLRQIWAVSTAGILLKCTH